MLANTPEKWDRVVDAIVVGSGGAALTAATMAHDGGAEVLVLEKADMIGGTTAVSGGVAWLPGNHHMAEVGIPDSREEALAYLRRLTCGHEHDPAVLEAFVDTAPEVLTYLEAHTPLRMQPVANFPDYFFPYDVPGKKWGGRSCEPLPYAVGTEIPAWRDRLVTRGTLMSLGSNTMLAEDFAPQTDELKAELARREALDIRTKGAALIAMMFKGLLDRGVEVLLETPERTGRGRWQGHRRARGIRWQEHAHRRAKGCGARVRWLRVEPRDGQSVHRLRGEAVVAAEQHRRWADDGNGGRRAAREHDVVLRATSDVRS